MKPLIRHTLIPGIATHLALKVIPNAICRLRRENESDPKKHLKLFSDPEGFIHFHAKPSAEHSHTAKIMIECEKEGNTEIYPYEFRSSFRPTNDVPLPPDLQNHPKTTEHTVRPPLSEEEIYNLSNVDLLKRGYPHRPDPKKSLGAFHVWKRSVSAPVKVIKPSVIAHPELRAGSTETSNNWSGLELRGGTGSFSLVSANWNVPTVFGNPADTSTNSAFWVGIDGDNLNDLVQAGTEQDAIDINFIFFNISFSSYYAWTEFLPQQPTEQVVNSFSVNPGDEMFVQVWIGNLGEVANLNGATGNFFLQNLTQGILTLVSTPVGSTTVLGQEAEWIMERPSFGNNPAPLAEYIFARMNNPLVLNSSDELELYSAGNPIQITMKNGNDLLSSSLPLGPDAILYLWAAAT